MTTGPPPITAVSPMLCTTSWLYECCAGTATFAMIPPELAAFQLISFGLGLLFSVEDSVLFSSTTTLKSAAPSRSYVVELDQFDRPVCSRLAGRLHAAVRCTGPVSQQLVVCLACDGVERIFGLKSR